MTQVAGFDCNLANAFCLSFLFLSFVLLAPPPFLLSHASSNPVLRVRIHRIPLGPTFWTKKYQHRIRARKTMGEAGGDRNRRRRRIGVLYCIAGFVGATFADHTLLDDGIHSPPNRRQIAPAISVTPRIVTTTVFAPVVTQSVVTRTQTIIGSGSDLPAPTSSPSARIPASTSSNTTVPAGYTVPRAFEYVPSS